MTIRLTKQERDFIRRRAKKAQLSLTDFVVALAYHREIVVPPDLSPLLLELKRMGNNVNQIAQKVNAGVLYSANFQEVVSGLRELYEAVDRLAGGGVAP